MAEAGRFTVAFLVQFGYRAGTPLPRGLDGREGAGLMGPAVVQPAPGAPPLVDGACFTMEFSKKPPVLPAYPGVCPGSLRGVPLTRKALWFGLLRSRGPVGLRVCAYVRCDCFWSWEGGNHLPWGWSCLREFPSA